MPGFLTIAGTAHLAALTPATAGEATDQALFDGHHVWVHLDGNIHAMAWHPAVTHFAGD